jgi:hypothetical protein
MIDMFTDILMVLEFMRDKKTKFAYIMIGSVFANLGIQLIVAFIKNFRLGWRKVLKEMLIVLACLKPGADVFRVTSDTKVEVGQNMDPTTGEGQRRMGGVKRRPFTTIAQ